MKKNKIGEILFWTNKYKSLQWSHEQETSGEPGLCVAFTFMNS